MAFQVPVAHNLDAVIIYFDLVGPVDSKSS